MLIPSCCFSCGTSLFDKWYKYRELVTKYSAMSEYQVKTGVVKPDKKMLLQKTARGESAGRSWATHSRSYMLRTDVVVTHRHRR